MTTEGSARTTETNRVEAFSDAVFAIALTLLVLDLRPPEPHTFAESLLREWPTYLAYSISFLTIGSIWLSHHNVFSRIQRADPIVLVLNLGLLLGVALVPWPTGLISAALGDGSHADQVAAILVYSLVTFLVGAPWAALSLRLARRPRLLNAPADVAWMRRNGRQSLTAIAVSLVGAGLAFWLPLASLVLYLVVPTGFLLSTLLAREPADRAR